MGIVWLASYPKSGNTYARMLLHNYLYGETTDTEVVAERIPGIHSLMGNNTELKTENHEKRIVKSHFCLTRKHPYFDQTLGFIYILRNPRDVLLSSARYLCETSSPEELRQFAKTFIENLGAPIWQESKMGTWPEHVASWLYQTPRIQNTFIKYEDMRSDPAAALKRMVIFMEIEPNESRIQAAVDSCEIGKAREVELAEKKRGQAKVYAVLPNNGRFVGEGKVGQSLTGIGEDIERLYKNKFGNFAGLFGYE
jgi:Sulfotransferase domain